MKPALWISILAAAFPGVLMTIEPVFRRPTLLFGVHVAPEFGESAEARRIVLRFRLLIGLSMLVEIFLGANGFLPGGALLLFFGATAAFAWARRATRPHAVTPSPKRSAALSPDVSVSPAIAIAAILPLILLAGAALWMQLHWDSIPDRFPVHYDIHGTPNRWSNRSWRGVFGPVLIGIPVLLLVLVIAGGLAWRSPRGGGSPGSLIRNLRALIAVEWAVSLLFCWITLSPLVKFRGSLWIALFVVAATTAILIWNFARASKGMDATDNTPDDAWKFGMIYYNPADPAFVVPKRFGVGYTFNFGNRLSWAPVMLVVIILVVTVTMVKAG